MAANLGTLPLFLVQCTKVRNYLERLLERVFKNHLTFSVENPSIYPSPYLFLPSTDC
jgi:hypothetical protein